MGISFPFNLRISGSVQLFSQDSARGKASPAGKVLKLLRTWDLVVCTQEWANYIFCFIWKAIFNWIERKDSRDAELNGPIEKENFEIQHTGSHPIDDILLWHKAIKRDLNETFEKIKRMYLSGNFTSRSVCEERVRFIAEVCIFHRYSFL